MSLLSRISFRKTHTMISAQRGVSWEISSTFFEAFYLPDVPCELPGKRHASASDAEENKPLRPFVLLQYLVRHPLKGAVHGFFVHQLRFGWSFRLHKKTSCPRQDDLLRALRFYVTILPVSLYQLKDVLRF